MGTSFPQALGRWADCPVHTVWLVPGENVALVTFNLALGAMRQVATARAEFAPSRCLNSLGTRLSLLWASASARSTNTRRCVFFNSTRFTARDSCLRVRVSRFAFGRARPRSTAVSLRPGAQAGRVVVFHTVHSAPACFIARLALLLVTAAGHWM